MKKGVCAWFFVLGRSVCSVHSVGHCAWVRGSWFESIRGNPCYPWFLILLTHSVYSVYSVGHYGGVRGSRFAVGTLKREQRTGLGWFGGVGVERRWVVITRRVMSNLVAALWFESIRGNP